jgi:O-antigen/teichoic acid export membrane protein
VTGRGSTLLAGSLAALASRGVGIGVSLLTGVIVARTWGLEGKGLLSLLAAATVLVVRVGVVGFDTSVAHFLLVRRVEAARSLGTVFALAATAGVGGALLSHVGLMWLPAERGDVALTAARLQASALPAAFVLVVVTYVFFALGRGVAFAVFDVGYRLSTLAATIAAAMLGAGILTVVSLQVAAGVTSSAVGLSLVWRWSGGGWRWSRPLASAMIGYGARTWVYGLGRYVLAYGSLLVSGAALGAADAGLLSVALTLGEVVALTAGSVNLAFGRTVSLAERPWSHAWRVAARVTLMVALLALAIALSAPLLVPALFGASFAGSASLFPWLVPGIIALGAEQIIASYFARIGMSWRVAGLMAGGAALAVAVWGATAGTGLRQLAWTTSLLQVAVTLVMAQQFWRARHANPTLGGLNVDVPPREPLDV